MRLFKNLLTVLVILTSTVASAQVASSTQYGVVKYDPASFTTVGGVLKSLGGSTYTLPTASASTLGGIKIGTGLTIAGDGTVTASGGSSGPIDYSQTGTVIDDGGGVTGTNTSAKVFDGDKTTYYDANNADGGKYVGRNFGSAKFLTLATILPRQSDQAAQQINGAQLQYSANGTTYTTIYTVQNVSSSNYTAPISATFTAISAQYWRLYFPNSFQFGSVAEINFTYVPPGSSGGTAYTLPPATSSVLGGVKAGSGINVASDGTISTATATPSSNTLTVTVTDFAGLQSAIANAVPNTTITWSTTINQTADINISNLVGLTLEGYGQGSLTRADSPNQIFIRGNVVNLKIAGISFVNTQTSASGGIGMVVSNQQGPVDGLTIERCKFTNASAVNALSLNCVGGGNSEFVTQYRKLIIRNNKFGVGGQIGRMAIEILNHVWDGTATQLVTDGVLVEGNEIENTGAMDPNGMGVSISGLHKNVQVLTNRIKNARLTSLEIIGGDGVVVEGNNITDGANSTVAIVISDGYKNGTSGFVKNMIVTNNISNTKDRGLVLYYATNVTYANNVSTSLINSDVKSSDCSLVNNTIISTTSNSALTIDASFRNTISNNRLVTQGGQRAAVLTFFNNSSGNMVRGNILTRPTGSTSTHIEQASGSTNNLGVAGTVNGNNGDNQLIER